MRTMSAESAVEVIKSGKKFLGQGVVAVDLAGPEEKVSVSSMRSPFV